MRQESQLQSSASSLLSQQASEAVLIETDDAGDPESATATNPEPRLARPKTAMITGAGGLLGRAMTTQLQETGWRVVPLIHSDLDITNDVDVQSTIDRIRPDVLINCVATADVDRCEIEPEWAHRVNEKGPDSLARACRLVEAEIVHISTDYVFDGSKTGFYTQDDEASPLSVYGESKLAGEKAVCQQTDRAYVVRTSWLFGVGGKNFGSRVIEYARKGASLKGITDQISIPTYAPDLAARIERIVDIGVHGLYQVTSTGPTNWFEFARLALDLAGFQGFPLEPVTRASLNQRAPRPQNSAMRCLLSERLQLPPLRHWKDALAEFVRHC